MKRVAQVPLLVGGWQIHLGGVDEGHAGLVVAAG